MEGRRKDRGLCAIKGTEQGKCVYRFFLLRLCHLEEHLFSFSFLGLLIAGGGFELLLVDNETFLSKWIYVELYFNVPRR